VLSPVEEAVYGYWSQNTSPPAAFSASIRRRVSAVWPQQDGPPVALWWEITVRQPLSRATVIISRTAGIRRVFSERMWTEQSPPHAAATRASAVSSAVCAKIPGG
jgi:hypothetical protein